ncbi:MAG TPA: hypothetical protein VK176_06815 [Phycisphaerales bacterium]|nr:hypothetical protein [Phycisphaerales bacterium]
MNTTRARTALQCTTHTPAADARAVALRITPALAPLSTLLLAAILAIGGCESADKPEQGSARWGSSSGPTINAGDGIVTSQNSFTQHPFDPVSMRIHPLTHLQRAQDVAGAATDRKPEAQSGPRINCFVEFKDQWGDTCKALGILQVQLYRPAAEPGQERQDAKWDADLTDLARNADWFDPVTRAYRLQLQVPDWLGDPGKDGQIKLRVIFTPSSGGSDARKLRDEFIVAR